MGAKPSSFKKKLLASSISSCLLASAGYAIAQEDPELEEVVVTGIRASVQQAMDIKRDSAGVVDAISAEDMGKFPDTNLAESLQRITGVSIDRANGEGSQITVRGFGPDFNMVTLNGRTMPTGSTYGGSSGADTSTRGGASRAFDFQNLASESVSGVEVYKTGKASITTGGIGATVNVLTARPLDNPGLNASIGAKAVMDTTNRTGDDITPEISGILSWTDDNDMFGVSLSASVQERHSGYTGATVNEWNIGYWGQNDLYNLDSGVTGAHVDSSVFDDSANLPEIGQLYARPNDIRYAWSDSERTRTNTQLTLQFAPNDEITATLDYTFAQNERSEHRGELTNWVQNGSNLVSVVFDDSVIATPLAIGEAYSGTRDIGMSQQYRSQEDTLDSIGLNVEWAVNDVLTLTFDAHDSSMESLPTGPGRAGELDVGLGAPIKVGKVLDYSGDLPGFAYLLDDSATNNNGQLDPQDISSTVLRVFSAEQLSDVTQIKLDGSFEFDEGRFDFGIESRDMSATTASYNGSNQQVLGGWGASAPGEFPAGAIESFNVTGEFDDFSTGISPATGFRGDARVLAAFLVEEYADYPFLAYVGLENTAGATEPLENGEMLDDVPDVRNSKSIDTIEEDTTAAYFQFSTTGEVGPFEVGMLAGLRYETTDQTSISGTPPVDYFIWTSDNDFTTVNQQGVDATISENSYDALLPSLDVNVNFMEDLVGRFSYSKTIARAGLGNLTSSVSGHGVGGSTLLQATPTANSNNPFLIPLESSNYDMSLEWYFDETSYASFGLWEKRVLNFVGTEQVDRTFGIKDQTAGQLAQDARTALVDLGETVDDANLYTMMIILGNPDDFSVTDYVMDDPNDSTSAQAAAHGQQESDLGEGCTQDSWCNIIPADSDPEMVFRTSNPVNNEEAKIYGAEMAVQHFFGDTGFGVMANYTIVKGDVKFNDLADPNDNQFALIGLSDTANLVLMYENYGIQARLAYNWRDKFLAETNRKASNNPRYVEEYSQIDFNVSYEVLDGLSVSFEGLNITGEDRREHGRNERMLWGLEDLGPRYQIGARYTF